MKNLLPACAFLLILNTAFSQSTKIKAEKYPSLLWEITGKGLAKPSYLFGTMHVSSKMVFHLSDSFYLGIRNAQVVALETNPGTWQEDFSRYDLEGNNFRQAISRFESRKGHSFSAPQDYLTISSLKLPSFEKLMEAALYSNPSMLNSFLYRSNSETGSDFEEDTYLDLHIFQAGRKLGKKVCGVEDFHGSMRLVKEAYRDAAREKKKKRGYDYNEDFSFARMEEAYRTGNLDLLDTINKVNSQSAAFDEKFLYKRNDIQAASIDSILRTGASLFVGVGAAHLPGERGVIEILRRQGYKLRPIRMKERDSRHKESIEKIRVPVQFSRQGSEDGFFSVMAPGRFYSFSGGQGNLEMKQFADMTNGSYYMVTRLATHAAIQGQNEAVVQRKLDSVLYENIPGKILLKRSILRNGYRGYDITNRTRRGDYQRYNIFITPFEVLIFKMSGNGDYVRLGTEADQFFSSIQLKEQKSEWKKWSPSFGGFEVELPHTPLQFSNGNQVYAAFDPASTTAFEVIRTDVHNHDFVEEDSFDLSLMEESFATSDCIARNVSRQWTKVGGYPALDARYRYKDSSTAVVRFLINGPHYYTLVAAAKEENRWMAQFLRSFKVLPYRYTLAKPVVDTFLNFRVQTPVALEKDNKLSMYPEDMIYGGYSDNPDDSLVDNGTYKNRIIASDPTGEKIHVSFYKHSPYFFQAGDDNTDSTQFKKNWIIRRHSVDTLQNGLVATDMELGSTKSSRVIKARSFLKQGMGYMLATEQDTLTKGSAFVDTFFKTFEPLDSLHDAEVKKKKTALFFSQFFSADTMQHKKAVKNIGSVVMDSTDFQPLQQAINSLNWREKSYLEAKKELISKLAGMPTASASGYLKTLYYLAGDTAELQYAALESLLAQKTVLSYHTFAQIMQNDPPVLDVSVGDRAMTTSIFGRFNADEDNNNSGSFKPNGSFFDNLHDSLQLTASIMKSLLPLINLDDYEQPMMALMGTLVDSNLLKPADYEVYLPKFVLEAKQLLKKQLIQEKTKSIERARMEGDDTKQSYRFEEDSDNGNYQLSLYATLLMPFREKNSAVDLILQQLLKSRDKLLQYNTVLLLLQNDLPVPDSLVHQFAALDEFRHEFFIDLESLKKEVLFPAAFKTQELMARSRLVGLQMYDKPDSIVYLQKVPLAHNGEEGFLYFFKYKDKQEDLTWKFATAGLYPKDSSRVVYDTKEDEEDFTELTATRITDDSTEKEQAEKLLKKLTYSRRRSAERFYEEENRYGDYEFTRMQ